MSKKTPAPDKKQLTMFPELARVIHPASQVAEPALWFRELRLLKKLDAREDSDDFIRKIEFRPGLNVLWAEPEPADSELSISGLYADGFSGHATGKTLFCRILRYLLGDSNFATKDDRDGIHGQFLELWAVAEIRLNGQSWIVGRSMAGPGDDFAESEASIDEVVSRKSHLGEYSTFKEALERGTGDIVKNLHPNEGWRHLLPWLTRDQEARFSAINAWRDSLSEADHPRATSEKQHLLMRTVLRLLDSKEFDLRDALGQWDETEKDCFEKIPNKSSLADNDLRALKSTIGSIEGISLDLEDLEADMALLQNHIEVRQEALAKIENTPESPEIRNAREAYEGTAQTVADALNRIKDIDSSRIPELEKEQKRTLGYVDQIKKKGIKDPTRVNQNFCPNSIQFARERKCVNSPDSESQLEASSLIADAKELAKRIEALKSEKAALVSKTDQLEAAKQTALTNFNKVRAEQNREANKLNSSIPF